MKRGDKPAANEPIPGAKEVSQAYGALPNTEVPPELDARVLARARGAIDKSSKVVSLTQAKLRRWAIPLSTAASVIVVMSVVYEMQFNTPKQTELQSPIGTQLVTDASPEQDASASNQEERAPAATGNSRQAALEESVAPRASESSDAARGHVVAPPAPLVAPSIAPVIVTFPESASLAPPVSLVEPPSSPSPAPSAPQVAFSEAPAVMANASREEKKEQEISAAADKALAKIQTEHARSNATQSAQLQGLAAKRAAAQASLPDLKLIAGHYTYQSYRLVTLSGERMDLKKLGYTAATLDIDANGTLTRHMTAADGKVTTQTATVLEVKLANGSGRWTVIWSDLGYPVEATLFFDASKLTSRTQFEHISDADRFGNVELATLQRIGS